MGSIRRLMIAQSQGGRLPSEYQQVEWIGARGSQYLKTNVSANSNVDVFIEFMIMDSNSSDNALFGASSNTYMYWCNIYGNQVHWRYNKYISGNLGSIEYNTWHTTNTVKNAIYINGVLKTTISGEPFAIEEPYDVFWIFALNANGNPFICRGINIRKIVFTDNTTDKELLNCIPCYRKSDGVIGMYDLISRVFLTNQGSGTFTKGADI